MAVKKREYPCADCLQGEVILETGNDSFRFKASSATAAQKRGEKANPLTKP
ncbi:hypothetical protein [Martelella soudanensis]|uniref:hypothetical protein n=1 Tax=unclassified Martelella TaxID=2629616 RepID=UPI0015DFCC97|nr:MULTISPECIES: hypothetical protein [unclassified Martelella]